MLCIHQSILSLLGEATTVASDNTFRSYKQKGVVYKVVKELIALALLPAKDALEGYQVYFVFQIIAFHSVTILNYFALLVCLGHY